MGAISSSINSTNPIHIISARRLNSQSMKKSSESKVEDQGQDSFESQAIPLMPELYGAAMKFTRNPTDAEDLIQETFLKAFKAWHQYENGTNLKAWLSKIMYNTYVNSYHKKNRDQAKDSIDNLEEWQIGGATSLTASASKSAEAVAIANMPAEVVKLALEDLREEFREVVLQAIVLDLSYADIAKNMGTPVGTVMSRLHRGKKELREKLASYAAEQGIGLENVQHTKSEKKK